MIRNISCITVLCLALSACSVKRKMQTEQQETTALQRQQETQLQYHAYSWQEEQGDSSNALWQLLTSRPFYYHPDSGLYAAEGELRVAVRSVKHTLRVQDSLASDITVRDSSGLSRTRQLRQQSSQTAGNRTLYWIGAIALLALCATGCYYGVRLLRTYT